MFHLKSGAILSFVILLLACCSEATSSSTVSAKRGGKSIGPTPLYGKSGIAASVFDYNYNSAWVPPSHEQPTGGLLVRCQFNTSDEGGGKYGNTPSVIAFSSLEDLDTLTFSPIDNSSVVLQGNWTEDPRVILNNGTYYLAYTNAFEDKSGDIVAQLSLATSTTPSVAKSWVRHGPIYPQVSYSKSASILASPDLNAWPHYMFWGDSSLVPGLQVGTSTDLLHWAYNDSIWLKTRPDSWDSVLVEAGPLPLPLSDGNYLFLYNSARAGYPSPKPGYEYQYNIGYVILDSNDPTKILQRSSEPILSPELSWEVNGLTPNVVFVEGWEAIEGTQDTFLIYYGAADTTVGTAIVSVTMNS